MQNKYINKGNNDGLEAGQTELEHVSTGHVCEEHTITLKVFLGTFSVLNIFPTNNLSQTVAMI